jgi:hypothetical protein
MGMELVTSLSIMGTICSSEGLVCTSARFTGGYRMIDHFSLVLECGRARSTPSQHYPAASESVWGK